MSMEYPCVYFEKNGRCRKFSDDTAVSYCVMGPCPEQTLSNADRLRAMSDEELANEMQKRSISTISTLQAENEKLRAELEQVKQLYETEKEDFLDYACSGIPNFAPYCFNRCPDCVDERGWCKTEKCRGFSRERGQKED